MLLPYGLENNFMRRIWNSYVKASGIDSVCRNIMPVRGKNLFHGFTRITMNLFHCIRVLVDLERFLCYSLLIKRLKLAFLMVWS